MGNSYDCNTIGKGSVCHKSNDIRPIRRGRGVISSERKGRLSSHKGPQTKNEKGDEPDQNWIGRKSAKKGRPVSTLEVDYWTAPVGHARNIR